MVPAEICRLSNRKKSSFPIFIVVQYPIVFFSGNPKQLLPELSIMLGWLIKAVWRAFKI
jgi:hypothetical protein